MNPLIHKAATIDAAAAAIGERYNALRRRTVEEAIAIGNDLIDLKMRCNREGRKFGEAVAIAGIAPRTATQWMAIAEGYKRLPDVDRQQTQQKVLQAFGYGSAKSATTADSSGKPLESRDTESASPPPSPGIPDAATLRQIEADADQADLERRAAGYDEAQERLATATAGNGDAYDNERDAHERTRGELGTARRKATELGRQAESFERRYYAVRDHLLEHGDADATLAEHYGVARKDGA